VMEINKDDYVREVTEASKGKVLNRHLGRFTFISNLYREM